MASFPKPIESFSSITNHFVRTGSVELSMKKDDMLVSRRIFGGTFGAVAALALGGKIAVAAEAMPTYLTEPTEEFKESERQREEFRRKQLVIKSKFTTVIDRLSNVSQSEKDLCQDLVELKQLVIETGGLPLGIKKEELYKKIRAKKAKGFWPTKVEIAYQSLIFEVSYQQSPNKDKDTSNPL